MNYNEPQQPEPPKQLSGEELVSMVASFGHVGNLPGNVFNSVAPAPDFKKKSKANIPSGGEIPSETNYQYKATY